MGGLNCVTSIVQLMISLPTRENRTVDAKIMLEENHIFLIKLIIQLNLIRLCSKVLYVSETNQDASTIAEKSNFTDNHSKREIYTKPFLSMLNYTHKTNKIA